MTLTYELTQDDGIALGKYLWLRPERKNHERRTTNATAIAIAVIIWLVVARAIASQEAALLIALFTGLAILKYLPELREKKARRWTESDMFSRWLGSRTLSLEERGLRILSQRGERVIFWETISELAETDDHLFLPFGMLEVVVIPKRAFESDDQRLAFVTEVNARRAGAAPLDMPPTPATDDAA